MARPFKHPKTGIYWFRKRVPDKLRDLVGKTEEKVSLRTRDPLVAKVEHARMAAKVEARWMQLAAGPQNLSHMQAESIAGEIYRALTQEHRDNPDQVPDRFGGLLMDRAFLRPGTARIFPIGMKPEATAALIERLRTRRNAHRVDAWLRDKGWLLDHGSHAKVLAAVDRAVLQAREQLERMAGGDYRPDPDADRFPAFEEPKTERPKATGGDKRSQSILSVFDVYAKERELSASSIKKWRPTFAGVQKEVPTLADLSRDWVLAWKDRLIGRNLDPKHVAESYIAPLRALCEWAVDNDYLDNNPVAKVKIKIPPRAKTRPQGYTDEEANQILSATLWSHPKRLTPAYRNVRRWVPWLCAYSGARVGEIAQLRREDIHMKKGVALLWITPEAGTTKDGNSRYVAVHPDLIRQGFLDFVEAARPGPLFYDPQKHRGGTDQNPQFRKIGERLASWIRNDVKLTDTEIRPSHAWRHRFKTVSRNVGMDSGARDYMMGHAPATVGEEYGDWLPEALLREISKMPAIDLRKGGTS